jgi:HEAT repeat protein
MKTIYFGIFVLSIGLVSSAQAGGLPKNLNYHELLDYLQNGSAAARREACHRLGKRRMPESIPAIGERVLKDDLSGVRAECLEALAEISNSSATSYVLKAARKDPDPWVRKKAMRLLVNMGPQGGFATFHKIMLEDPSPELRREASALIERHPQKSSLKPLCKALRDSDRQVVANAANGLYRLGFRQGAQCLREASKEVRDNRLANQMNKMASKLER